MSLWAIIPVRGFASGKSRLASGLSQEARIALNMGLFAHTVRCATRALGAERVLMVSPDEAVICAAKRIGIGALREREDSGLNGGLLLANRAAVSMGATALLSLSCDLPLLSASDVVDAANAWRGDNCVVLATDEFGTGTNALIVPALAQFTYCMGHGSAALHRYAAGRAGLAVVEVKAPGLNFDLDTPDDLARWRGRVFRPDALIAKEEPKSFFRGPRTSLFPQ